MMGNKWVLGLHLIFISIFLVATNYTCLVAQNMTVSCKERERLALLKFKRSVKDDFGILSSWVGGDCCSWKGVRCDKTSGSVVSLHLRGNYWKIWENELERENYLVGDRVNAYLENLRHLKHLDLSGNNFQGSQIPTFIGSFKHLSYLNLSHACFSGIIPYHIGNLSSLKVLDLGSFHFNPYISWQTMSNDMAWVSGLSSLEHLDLSEVDVSQAKNVNMVFYVIPSLSYLSLRDCGLSNVDLVVHLNSSKILPNIKHLDLSSNNFEGQLPHFLQNLTSLTFLDLSSYNLNLAWNSANLLNIIPSLLELHLSMCGLHNAPSSPTNFNFSHHSNIQYLDLSHNLIEGRFPSELMNMTSLLKLDVSNNNFEHIEDVGIWRQCHIKELSLSGNNFAGELLGQSTNTSECSHYALEMLDLYENQLLGSIPEALGKLSNLRVLRLYSNSLTGFIPKALQRLKSLEVLDLYNNGLTGSIPTFLGRLTELDLSTNQFSGLIPKSLGSLTTLTNLNLESNCLIGSIPTSLGRLASLQTLLLSTNLLNGTIPISVGQLTKLVKLSVYDNNLQGVVSEAHFAKLSMLKYLHTSHNNKLIFNISNDWTPPFQLRRILIGSCKIVGGFPTWLQTQRKIKELLLSNTSLYGPLPTWLRKMHALSYINLSYNQLSGSLINLPSRNLNILLLQDNLFNGSIPRSMCGMTLLVLLDVSGNTLSGNIPDCVGNLQDLEILILSSNRLSGVLPISLGNISLSLHLLKLNDNDFHGELPKDLENLISLRVMDLGNNKFSGNIPKWIGENLTRLVVLRLRKNNFTGRFHPSLCKCSYLQILDVAHNNLSRSIPHCIGNLSGMIEARNYGAMFSNYDLNVFQVMKGKDLEYTTTVDLVFNMDLSSNKLTGEIPRALTTLILLLGLNLSHNQLSGSIPDSLGNMKALNSLDFSDNQLTGMIPPGIGALNFLSCLNLSHNNLSGKIPTGNQLETLTDPTIYAGNTDLCGAPLPNNCSNHDNRPITTSKNVDKNANQPNMVWFYVDSLSGFATGFWGIIGVLLFKKQWRQKLLVIAEATVVRVSKIKRGR